MAVTLEERVLALEQYFGTAEPGGLMRTYDERIAALETAAASSLSDGSRTIEERLAVLELLAQ
jgi:hypothetical protein